MKTSRQLLITLCMACGLSGPIFAYERATHAAITNSGFQQSQLNFPANGLLLEQLGLDVTTLLNSQQPFGKQYVSIQGDPTTPIFLPETDFEYGTIQDGIQRKHIPIDIPFWLMCGVVREDDVPGEPPALFANIDGTIKRPFNHFYDPIHNIPLTIGIAVLGDKAPDWATGATDSFKAPNVLDTSTANHYTVFDAHEAMFRALTQQTQNAGIIQDLVNENNAQGYDAGFLTSLQSTRNAYWATTFRALGDVLHLNQDMAQPQHTRNEAHNGLGGPLGVFRLVTGHESVYELYMDARAKGKSTFAFKYEPNLPVTISPDQFVPPPLVYSNGFPIPAGPTFTQYSNFWSTGSHTPAGSGLADYSNGGFYTAANNVSENNYFFPNQGDLSDPVSLPPTNWANQPLTGPPIVILPGIVSEQTWDGAPDATGIALTTHSLWDQFMLKQGTSPTYTLNRINYDAMGGLLIPRATAYSAGLINFFFRGQMAISLPHEGVYGILDHSSQYNNNRNTAPLSRTQGFSIIKLQLANTTSTGEAMTGGTLTAVLKFHRNLNFMDDLSQEPGTPSGTGFIGLSAVRGPVEEVVVSTATRDVNGALLSQVAVPKTPMELEFDFAEVLPLNATDVALQVVYRGALGTENDAVVVATSYISSPTYFSYINAFDYIRLGTHVYTRAQINANPTTLLPLVRPTTCVDNSVSPPVLSAGCFPANQTLTVTLDHKDTTLPTPLVLARNIPTQNYLRIAVLTDGGQSGQAVLQQSAVGSDGLPCLPTDAFTIPALNNGFLSFVDSTQSPATAQLFAFTDPLSAQRGILGWFTTSCVYNGDGTVTTPTTPPDDRATVMATLTGTAIFPVQTTVKFPQPPQ
jgi:hypothetical protein